MPAADDRSQDVTAIQAAMLAAYEEGLATLPLSAVRTGIRLDKYRLGWLTRPWMLLSLIRSTLRAVRPTGTYELAVQRFAEASGKPPDTSEAEVDRIMDQLRLIDQRAPYWHVPELAAATPANRTELQLTADVLLQHSLNDRQTTDSLLVEMQDAYGPCEQLLQQREEQPVDRHRRRASTSRDPSVRQLAQAHQRYLQAWRRWFDHVHPSGDSVGQEGAE